MENTQEINIQLTRDDKRMIQAHAKDLVPPNCYLEIGVHEGGSALQALEAARPDIELYGVDILNNFKLKGTRFNFIHSPSVEAAKTWNKPIGLLFIDGNHAKAKEDFDTWEKFVVVGGAIIFHDYARHSPQVVEDCEKTLEDERYKLIFRPQLVNQKIATSIFQIRKIKM